MVLSNRLLESGSSSQNQTEGATITTGGVQANWNSTTGPSSILNKPTVLSTYNASPSSTSLYSSVSLNTLLRSREILQSFNNHSCHITNGNLTLVSANLTGTIKCEAQSSPTLILQGMDGTAGVKVLGKIDTCCKNINNGVDVISELRTVKLTDTYSVLELRPRQGNAGLRSILQIGRPTATTGSDVTINGTSQVTGKLTADEVQIVNNITFIDGSKQYKALPNPTQTQANNNSFLKATAAGTWDWSTVPSSNFLTLSDVLPSSYIGNHNRIVKVAAVGNKVEFGGVFQSDVINHFIHLGNTSSAGTDQQTISIGVGSQSSDALKPRTNSVFIGSNSGGSLTASTLNNTCVGKDTMHQGSGSNNVYLGAGCGKSASSSNCIFIGTNVGQSNSTSNKLIINNGMTNSIIHGTAENTADASVLNLSVKDLNIGGDSNQTIAPFFNIIHNSNHCGPNEILATQQILQNVSSTLNVPFFRTRYICDNKYNVGLNLCQAEFAPYETNTNVWRMKIGKLSTNDPGVSINGPLYIENMPLLSSTEYNNSPNGTLYKDNNGYIKIKGTTGSGGAVSLPSHVNGWGFLWISGTGVLQWKFPAMTYALTTQNTYNCDYINKFIHDQTPTGGNGTVDLKIPSSVTSQNATQGSIKSYGGADLYSEILFKVRDANTKQGTIDFYIYSTNRPVNTTAATMTLFDDTVHIQKLITMGHTILHCNVDFGTDANTFATTQNYRTSLGSGATQIHYINRANWYAQKANGSVNLYAFTDTYIGDNSNTAPYAAKKFALEQGGTKKNILKLGKENASDTNDARVFGTFQATTLRFDDGTAMTTAGGGGAGAMTDTAAVSGQQTLRASNSSATNYALKTIKEGTNISFSNPEDQDCIQINSTVPYSLPNTSSFALGVNALANSTSTDSFAIGPGAMENTSTSNMLAIGKNAGRNLSSAWSVLIGKDAGARGSNLGTYSNIYIGGQCGYNCPGNSNIFIGRSVGYNSSESKSFKLGIMSNLLLEGKMPTNSSGANGEFKVNAPVVKLDPNIKTQADLASLAVGQIYVDTTAGNVLKMKL